MCTVSALFEYGRDRIPMDQWDTRSWASFQELVHHAEKFDQVTNQPDCVDKSKAEWAKKVEQRLRTASGAPQCQCGGDWPHTAAWHAQDHFHFMQVDPRHKELQALKQRIQELEQQLGV